jgi:outer membrane biosynthesis protein TonB
VVYTITKLGFTDDVQVVDGSGRGAKQALLKAVSEWRFTPAYIDGKAVDTTGVVAKYRWNVHTR